jgi:hypothetical protein
VKQEGQGETGSPGRYFVNILPLVNLVLVYAVVCSNAGAVYMMVMMMLVMIARTSNDVS